MEMHNITRTIDDFAILMSIIVTQKTYITICTRGNSATLFCETIDSRLKCVQFIVTNKFMTAFTKKVQIMF